MQSSRVTCQTGQGETTSEWNWNLAVRRRVKKKKGVYVCKMDEEERPFKAEYAKSGRAGCKLCKGAITKDTLRLAKMVQVSSECTLPCY